MLCDIPRIFRPSAHLCWLLTAAMALAPTAALRAQSPGGVDTQYVTSEAAVVAYLRPQQLLTSPNLEMMPVEVASAAGLQYLGIDPVNVSEVVAVFEPPNAGPPEYAVVLKLVEAFDLANLPEETRAHTAESKAGGKTYWKSNQPTLPSFYMPDDRTLVASTQGMLKKLFAGERPAATGELVDRIKGHSGADDLYLAVDVAKLQPLIQRGLMQAAAQAPPQAQEFFQAIQHIQHAELAVNLTGQGPTHLIAHAHDAASADQIEVLVDKAMLLAQEQMLAGAQQMLASDDPIQQAMGRYTERVAGKVYEPLRPMRDGEAFTLFEVNIDEQPRTQLAMVGIIGVLVAMGLPAVGAARGAARRNQSMNNMKQLLLSILNYESAHGELPAHASYDDDGKPLLSWRVHVLPYVEGQAIYDQFNLDEPWDSEHNKALIAQMPDLFASPNTALDPTEGKTNYVAPVGEGLLFDGTKKGAGLRNVTDGTSNTIALLEVDDEAAVIWTKPDDWKYDEEKPMKGLGGLRPGGFFAGFCDGSVRFIDLGIDVEVFKHMLTKSGGEVIDNR